MVVTNYPFGDFEVRADERVVLHRGQPVPLRARAFDLLLVLIERRDRVVSKDELLAQVWPGMVVEENNLSVQVSNLRKLFGAAAVSTVPGRGYRFTLALTSAADVARPPEVDVALSTAALAQLPAALPSLHGRDADLAHLGFLLSRHRLVTLVGAGGIGKTRLAQAAAAAAAPQFAGGACWVDLSPLDDPTLLLSRVALGLGVRLASDDTAQVLAARLGSRQMLLVLDNCEHLVQAVAPLAAALLQGAPGLHLLTTSQEPLRVGFEHMVRLGTLPVPEPGAHPLAERPAGGDALTLFEDRARAVQPQFTLHAGNLAAVLDICRRLDGIPLAIELAAARLPLLGLEGLRDRLNDRLRLLTSGSRLAPPRQQTLRAALDWSHGLLRPAEQRVFRRLGVFRGSFGLQMALQVTAEAGQDEWDVLDCIGGLVDKSLLHAEPDTGPGTTRHRLLQSARDFALEKLQAAGELQQTRRRHARALLEAFENAAVPQAPPTGTHPASPTARAAALAGDADDLREALAFSAGAEGDAVLHVTLAAASAWWWYPASVPVEGLHTCKAALARVTPETPASQEARLWHEWARLSNHTDAAAELAALDRAADLYRQAGELQGAFLCKCLRARKMVWTYDSDATRQAIDEAQALWSPAWPPALQEMLLQARTYAFEAAGRPADGEPLMRELVALMRRHGDEHQLRKALADLAESLFVQDKVDEAIEVRRELATRWRTSQSLDATLNRNNLAAALAHAGQVAEALALARDGMDDLQRFDRLNQTIEHFALMAVLDGRPADAAVALGCSDAAVGRSGFGREQSEQRACDRTRALVQAALPQPLLDSLLQEGAATDEMVAVRRAVLGVRPGAEPA